MHTTENAVSSGNMDTFRRIEKPSKFISFKHDCGNYWRTYF